MRTILHTWEKQKQPPFPTGFGVEEHLKETGLIDRCLSLDDEVVKGWIKNPKTYPQEYKDVYLYLWKSQRTDGSYRHIAYLYWRGDRVIVSWYWLEGRWRGYHPVLLASEEINKPTKVSKAKEIPQLIDYKGRIYKLVEAKNLQLQ